MPFPYFEAVDCDGEVAFELEESEGKESERVSFDFLPFLTEEGRTTPSLGLALPGWILELSGPTLKL